MVEPVYENQNRQKLGEKPTKDPSPCSRSLSEVRVSEQIQHREKDKRTSGSIDDSWEPYGNTDEHVLERELGMKGSVLNRS